MASLAPAMATGDSLEYYIKFPSSNSQNSENENEYVFVSNESNVPIVLLLGWAGCQDKYLMKYSKIYEDRGLITVRYTAPVENLFWKRSEMKQIGEKIVKLIFDMNFENHPIFFHVFSNGGAFLYQHISSAMQNSDKIIQVRGVIFDSAPGERRILSMYRAISAILGKERFLNGPLSIIITLFLSFLWLFEVIKKSFATGGPIQTNPIYSLKDEPYRWPQMFLYSKNDLLIPHTDVEKFAEQRATQGVDVTKVCFEGSEHVKHYSMHGQMYVQVVCTFINRCLSEKLSSSQYGTWKP